MRSKTIKTIIEISAMVFVTALLLVVTDFYCGMKDYRKTLLADTANKPAKTIEIGSDYKKDMPTIQKRVPKVAENSQLELTSEEEGSAEGADKKEAGQALQNQNLLNILLLGIDKMDSRDEWLGVYRTDTIAVASINLEAKKIDILSIPRDTYAYLPCVNKRDKINHAYAFGGMDEKGIDSTIEAVNELIKYSSINYYFALDMEPIPQIVDALGGVELDVEIDMKTYGADISRGMQILKGKQAFDYIHWRFSGNGDIDRIFRQQKFIRAVMNKLKDDNQLVNAVKLVLEHKNNIHTNMSAKQVGALAILANEIDPENVSFNTLPGRGEYIDGISYWVLNDKEADQLLKKHFGNMR